MTLTYPPTFPPVPKPPIPIKPGEQCVWFFYDQPVDETNGCFIATNPPTQGSWDMNKPFLPPGVIDIIPCVGGEKELPDGSTVWDPDLIFDPYIPVCITVENPDIPPICAKLTNEELDSLQCLITEFPVISELGLSFIIEMANRIGLNLGSLSGFGYYVLSLEQECNCNKWVVGCLRSDSIGVDPPPFFGGETVTKICNDPVLILYDQYLNLINVHGDVVYNVKVFGPGKNGYKQAKEFLDSISIKCYDVPNSDGSLEEVCENVTYVINTTTLGLAPRCARCCTYCIEGSVGYTTMKECKCNLPPPYRPQDCATPTPTPTSSKPAVTPTPSSSSPTVTPTPSSSSPTVTPTPSSPYGYGNGQAINFIP